MKHTFLFSLIAFAISGTINYLTSSIELDYFKWQYEEVTENNTPLDCIIIGNSRATHGIRPSYLDSLEGNFFNLALNGSDSHFYLKWYKEIFSKYHSKPKYCLLSVAYKGTRRYEHDSQFFPFQVFIDNLLEPEKFDREVLIKNRFPIYKFRELNTALFKLDRKSYFDFEGYDKGFIPYSSRRQKAKQFAKVVKPIRDSYQHKKSSIAALEELIKVFQDDNIKVVLVNIPLLRTKGKKAKIDGKLSRLAKKLKVPLLDYNGKRKTYISKHRKYYADNTHLNALGSIYFSKVLRKDLRGIMKFNNKEK